MNKENNSQFDSNQWYALWIKQTQEFFQSADANLKNIFKDQPYANPEQHRQQLEAWLETLKQYWQTMQLADNQKNLQAQWQTMLQMWKDAADLMMKEWMKRGVDQPIHNTQELYDLWLKCCGDVYKQHLASQRIKNNYNDFVSMTMDFWKGVLPK